MKSMSLIQQPKPIVEINAPTITIEDKQDKIINDTILVS